MFTAATLALLGPILGGGTIGQAVAFLGTPAGRVCKRVLMEAVKSLGKELSPEAQVRLARTNYVRRFARTRRQEREYIENGVKFKVMVDYEAAATKRR